MHPGTGVVLSESTSHRAQGAAVPALETYHTGHGPGPIPSGNNPQDSATSTGLVPSQLAASSGGYNASRSAQRQQTTKRTRVLLSCAPCRASKLKCDRGQPCSMCVKKERSDGCQYAPRPEKARPAKSMAARLKRLEGMVRDMMDVEEPEGPKPAGQVGAEGVDYYQGGGQVVVGGRGGSSGKTTTYVGATHFMAMLDDIEDLKSYFDDDAASDGSSEPDLDGQSPEIFMLQNAVPRSRAELLSYLPPRQIVDRLTMRYFSAYSPSQHIVHRPTFVKQYAEFWLSPKDTPLDWIALLFSIIALGTFFSVYTAPHELESDGDIPPMQRFSQYRTAAGWALVSAKYTRPGPSTLQPVLLYVEAEFLANRATQMNCYLLSSVCIRLMLKMGLHRDPSKLPNISPFDGEMRRRMWNLAIPIDLIVSFHMGLPSMIHGIESDTGLPRNLIDEDLSEDCTELPPSRPDGEYTGLTYPIWKSTICRVFGLVARQAHSLTLPTYPDVMRLDDLLEEKWKQVPAFMKVKPLEDSITDPPHLVNQRFGLASLYQKSRAVLHRRYLIEAVPRREHDYSRKTCLEAALSLLDYQNTTYQATLPGGLLRQNGWFITSLAIHDFLLASMVIYLVIQNPAYEDAPQSWATTDLAPDREGLIDILRRSHRIWIAVSGEAAVAKKACDILGTMLKKISHSGEDHGQDEEGGMGRDVFDPEVFQTDIQGSSRSHPPVDQVHSHPPASNSGGFPPTRQTLAEPQIPFSRADLMPSDETPWLSLGPNAMDWSSFDGVLRADEAENPLLADDWLQQRTVLDDLEFVASDFWGPPTGGSSQQGIGALQ